MKWERAERRASSFVDSGMAGSAGSEMTDDAARSLLNLSRSARWRYPTSSGRPVGDVDAAWVGPLADRQSSLIDAARYLLARGEGGGALEIAANIWRLWMISRKLDDGRVFLSLVLDHPAARISSSFRSAVLYGDGLLAFWTGKLDESIARNELALQIAQENGDARSLVLANVGLSRAVIDTGDIERSRTLALSARQYARGLDLSWEQAPLHMHAQAARSLSDYDQAAALFGESLSLNRSIGDGGMVVVELHNLGHTEIRRGNADKAERLFAECAGLTKPDDSYGPAMNILNRAAVAFARNDDKAAAELMERVESGFASLGVDPASDSDFVWLRERILSRARPG